MAMSARKMDENVFIEGGNSLYTSPSVTRENVRKRLAIGLQRQSW
jgi:hypothetical protein